MGTRTRYPKLGKARFTRPCPACGQDIQVGEEIAYQASLPNWVHPGCYFNPRLKRADAQLKDAFFATVQ